MTLWRTELRARFAALRVQPPDTPTRFSSLEKLRAVLTDLESELVRIQVVPEKRGRESCTPQTERCGSGHFTAITDYGPDPQASVAERRVALPPVRQQERAVFSPKDYRDYAKECMARAVGSSDLRFKRVMNDIAGLWMQTAMEMERKFALSDHDIPPGAPAKR
jgi:hypothetical protein